MPIIFGEKKKMVPVAVDLRQDKPDDAGASLKALADSILSAVESKDASALAQALKSFHLECEDYEKE